jgi:hypothetical protein
VPVDAESLRGSRLHLQVAKITITHVLSEMQAPKTDLLCFDVVSDFESSLPASRARQARVPHQSVSFIYIVRWKAWQTNSDLKSCRAQKALTRAA